MSRDAPPMGELAISPHEALETLRAIRSGTVDAVVVQGPVGEAVVTFQEPDHSYRALVEAMGEGAALVTRDGIIAYANPRFAMLTLGMGRDLRGHALYDLVVHDAVTVVRAMLERVRLGPARVEVALLSPDRGAVPVQLTASLASIADVEVVCVVATDLSEQRALSKLYRDALAGMQSRERLLSVAGHELRAPLQALVFDIGVVSALHRDGDPAVKRGMIAKLAAIHAQAMQVAALVGNLLDLGLVGSNQLVLAIADVDLAEVVRVAAGRSEEVLRSGSVLTLELAAVRGPWDRLRLEQVVTNLISNAAKYGLGRPIRCVVEGDAQVARLRVEDRGIGIAPDAIPGLFRPFERVGSVESAGGLGLGLYITAQIVKAHGGVIRVESVPRGGSSFVVELPRQP